MKKFLVLFLLIFTCFFFVPNKTTVKANTYEFSYNTLYPNHILGYENLTSISKLTVNSNYIAYTQDTSNIKIFNKSNKEITTISNFDNIVDIKFVKNNLIAITPSGIYYTKSFDNASYTSLNKINSITFSNLKAADIYYNSTQTYIGVVDNNTFKLYEFNLDLTSTKSNPTKTIQSNDFADAYLTTINDKSAYIIANKDSATVYVQNYFSNEIEPLTKKIAHQAIDTFYYNYEEYLLSFTGENLRLLTPDCTDVSMIDINEFDDIYLKISDIDYYDNTIYVADNNLNSIQTYKITEDESHNLSLVSDEILLSSSSKDNGRFNQVSNIIKSGSKLLVADTNNNRIQKITQEENDSGYSITASTIINCKNNSKPRSINLDSHNNIYIVNDTATNSQILKYSHNLYEEPSTTYEQIGLDKIGYIADTTIANDDSLFLLDYTKNQNKLLYLTNKGIEVKTTLPFSLNENSKITYLKELDFIVILNNNVLHIFKNNTNCSRLDSIAMSGTNITCDLNSIYVLDNNKIKQVAIEQNETNYNLKETTNIITNDHITNYSSIYYDIINNTIYGYNTQRQCIEYFDCSFTQNPFVFEDITLNPLQSSEKIIPVKLTSNPIIYDYPYFLGNSYNYDNSITNCFIIDDSMYNDYYRIIFNLKTTEKDGSITTILKDGFIKKTDAPASTHLDFEYKNINVRTIHQNVYVYKYPTLLHYNNKAITIGSYQTNTQLTLIAQSPIKIDNKQFYMCNYNNNIGFIFNADVVLDEKTHIEYLNNANATIKTYDKEPTIIYDEDKTTEITKVNNLTRVYVENLNEDDEFTKVIIKTDNTTIEGYVPTKYIQMDKLDNSKIIIICIIIFAFVLLGIIVISYIAIKKKKN